MQHEHAVMMKHGSVTMIKELEYVECERTEQQICGKIRSATRVHLILSATGHAIPGRFERMNFSDDYMYST